MASSTIATRLPGHAPPQAGGQAVPGPAGARRAGRGQEGGVQHVRHGQGQEGAALERAADRVDLVRVQPGAQPLHIRAQPGRAQEQGVEVEPQVPVEPRAQVEVPAARLREPGYRRQPPAIGHAGV